MQELCDGESIGCIKVARWLVSEDKLGMTDEGTGYGDALLLATRELVRIFIALGLKPHILESLVDAALALAAAADTEGAKHDIEVVVYGLVGQKLEVLEDNTHTTTELGEILALDVREIKAHYCGFALGEGYFGRDSLE
jgi:hypothetical protein